MPAAPSATPARLDAPSRLAALAATGLLDTPADAQWDRHTRLAARVLHAPVALVALVTAERQFFKSCVGLPEPWATTRETPLSHSFCQRVVQTAEPLVIDDARVHPLLRDNLAIRDLGVVAYLGVPLTTADGETLGSFCVIDGVPRQWTADDVALLETLAAGVLHEIEHARAMQASEAARQASDAARQASDAAYQAVVDYVDEVIFRTDATGAWTFLSPAWTAITGFSVADSLGVSFLDYVHEDDRAGNLAAFEPLVARRKTRCEHTVRYRTATGDHRWIEVRAMVTVDDAGAVTGTFGTLNDVTDKHRARQARDASHDLLAATLEATADGIVVIGADGCVAHHNRRFLELWGLTADETLGADRAALLDRALARVADPTRYRAMVAALHADPTAELAVLVHLADGSVMETTSRPQRRGADGLVVGRVWGFRDITERTVLEEQLVHQAFHDALTGLPNRAAFRARVERALAAADHERRSRDRVAVLLLDLDGFKLVNDSNGHAVGDELLVAVAERLLNATRGCDLVARLGGDEFGVLLENVRDDRDVEIVAERIVLALHREYGLRSSSVVLGASVGYARGASAGLAAVGAADDASDATPDAPGEVSHDVSRDVSHDAPVDALLRNADLALYEAKAKGKGRWARFHAALHTAAVERLALDTALRGGIERGEFRLVYQPIVDLDSADAVGVEALVRWHHPERGMISPLQFIPLAEETGLIIPLGRWVLGEACREGARWVHEAGLASITVNVSGRQLHQAGFVDDVRDALAASGLPPERLVLELTESSVIQDPEAALAKLRALRELGVRLAIDDFGTGYSALSYLSRFPLDVLKIDKSFVDGITDGGQPAALASAIVALGDALSLRTVAEGVESAAQREVLRGMGCAMGQGYHFARPLVPAQVDALLGLTAEVRAAA